MACPNVIDQCYQMVGNMNDLIGNRAKAVEAYMEGLKKFPNSGKLHLERGVSELLEKNYYEAVQWWEKGIVAEPTYSPNYYRLAQLIALSEDPLWALFYGELIMNIERGSKRTLEMSKLLYDLYKECIVINGNAAEINFTKAVINVKDADETIKIPFDVAYNAVFVSSLTPAIIANDTVSIRLLANTRKRFVANWFEDKHKTYPNILLDYHAQLEKNGFQESHTYWLLSEGNKEEFNNWVDQHSETYQAFIDWFKENRLPVSRDNYFLRTQYE